KTIVGEWKGFEPKTFGFLFYEIQAMLLHLQQKQGVVVLRCIGDPRVTFFQSDGGPFAIIEDVTSMDPMMKVVVIEGVSEIPREGCITRILPLTETLLSMAASEASFGPKTTVEDVDDSRAQDELRKSIAFAREKGCHQKEKPFFLIDHIYCVTLRRV
ncbi:MAG: hypothetical protein ACKVOH_03640, partial [Chlamydiales bacterium]